MADEQTVIESQASPEVQAEARKMGWQGPDKYKGDPEKFVDADTFVERGKTFIPFLNKERERLQQELAAERAARQAIEETVRETKASLEDLEERYTVETQKRTEAALGRLKAEIRDARKEGDFARMDELMEMQEELVEAQTQAKTEKPPAAKPPEAPVIDPAIVAWTSEHPWFNTDKEKSALFMGFAEARRARGDTSLGRAFLDAVLEEMEEKLSAEPPSKVAGARASGGGGGGSREKGYSDLPADAKAACDADASRFVGAGKKYKDAASWRAAYAKMYFE